MKPENVMGPDLIDDWAKIGNKLFNGSGVIPFVRENIFCNSFDRSTPSHPASMDSTSIQLNHLESLNPLEQKARFITCNSLWEGTGKRGMFRHSPETWKKMWEKIYQPGEARIQVELGPPEPITHLKDFKYDDDDMASFHLFGYHSKISSDINSKLVINMNS
ncbi:hypothetical protein H4Q26_000772 [Puccinia striiformis f. sp. tritici PST-130]|nr:hypothetical protein H4Q26_000772 [Puccinia striiformis f. sp. tritici PST-130]